MAICPSTNQPTNDIVMTPPALAKQLIDYLKPSGSCLDPCRGDGAFYNEFSRYTTETSWCEIEEGSDFLTADLPKVDWIISNPPWSKLRQFNQRAFELADNVAFLATVTNFVTKSRLRDAADAGFGLSEFVMVPRPVEWTSTGFQVAMAVYRRGAPPITKWTYL